MVKVILFLKRIEKVFIVKFHERRQQDTLYILQVRVFPVKKKNYARK